MNLETTYLGLSLPHPFVAGASPLADDLDMVRRLEDAGAAAIVMSSLFEEQIVHQRMSAFLAQELAVDDSEETLALLTEGGSFGGRPQEYLDHLQRVRRAVSVPIIGSLNGSTPGGWLEYARRIEEAGAAPVSGPASSRIAARLAQMRCAVATGIRTDPPGR